jgi:hypothetical protein
MLAEIRSQLNQALPEALRPATLADKFLSRSLAADRILGGPFRGMRYIPESLGSVLLPKFLGITYEEVSRSLLTNLSELNAFWQFWRPQIYRQVRWGTDKVSEKPLVSEQRSGHLFAFSSGVDSSATLRRHASEGLG